MMPVVWRQMEILPIALTRLLMVSSGEVSQGCLFRLAATNSTVKCKHSARGPRNSGHCPGVLGFQKTGCFVVRGDWKNML